MNFHTWWTNCKPQICGLKKFLIKWQFTALWSWNTINFAMQMWDLKPKCFADIKLPQIYYSFPYKFRQTNSLIQICPEYENSAEQTCGIILGDFVMKGTNEAWTFPKRWLIADLRQAAPKKYCGFAICRHISTNLRTCNLRPGTPTRNLEICESGMSPRICRFAILGLKIDLGDQHW